MDKSKLFHKNMPPPIEDVKIYFSQKGMPETEAESFFHFYNSKHWKSKKGNYFKNWKTVALRWIASILHEHPFLFDREIH